MLAAVSIPLITNLAIGFFLRRRLPSVSSSCKVVQVVAIVLVPVGVGMLVRLRSDAFAARADRPVRIFSIVVLVAVSLGAILGERDNIMDYTREVGLVVTLFCLAGLTLGYTGAHCSASGKSRRSPPPWKSASTTPPSH